MTVRFLADLQFSTALGRTPGTFQIAMLTMGKMLENRYVLLVVSIVICRIAALYATTLVDSTNPTANASSLTRHHRFALRSSRVPACGMLIVLMVDMVVNQERILPIGYVALDIAFIH